MTWNPYVGLSASYLAVTLFAIGVLLAYSGTRLKHAIKIPKAEDALSVLILVCWTICVVVLLVSERIIRRVAPQHAAQFASILSGPIFPITLLSAIITFAVVGYLCRSYGITVALGSALVGTAAAPMIFELPFVLIVMGTVKLTVFVALLFFLPLLLVTISTMSLLFLSRLTSLSNYTLFSLGGMFIVFSVWAFFGFAYPSDTLSFAMNGISKVLSFTTAITLFLKPNKN